ncbi:uncharacterized protein LOC110622285 [Manihot esculenta]|uniref:Uncharacterized protein n=1 Tax=Manihot esculenta TaxID=3983 RepID=A0A251K3X9_MANES|nr:uncharacterized protein LOC110622285 [Manihot esculenta]XP_021622444.1 uncharacterized protein LOC110622285 [Manihot esculenta]XP_043816186.1 uncharacterized protein LOC110622285 [Manihot esculenta]OAY41025.1 hypothetical protein MANES_09G068000v8 [Manihot esculenta]OAY41026.1 hypothetical protein MANES_09G068000v8 [Manihot esculenta]
MKKRNQTSDAMDSKDRNWDFKKIMKDIEFLDASHMTWKERKDLENQKVVSLGGKPPKKQRLPLSVARVQMKKQKEREEKMLQENMILGRFGGKLGGGAKRSVEKRKPENGVLRSSDGYFRNGVLDVKHMLNPAPSKNNDSGNHMVGKGKKKESGKKNRGKKKGGGRKRH